MRDWPSTIDAEQWEALARTHGTPFYAYDASVLHARCSDVSRAFSQAEVRYAMKANACPAVLDAIREEGFGIDAVSPWEARYALSRGFDRESVLYTGNFPSDDELREVAALGLVANLDALSALDRYGVIAKGARVAIRVDLEEGAGHHPHVVTAGDESKFGLTLDALDEALQIIERRGLRLVGLHQHIGSGLSTDEHRAVWLRAAMGLFDVTQRVEARVGPLSFVDVGGGFGVGYRDDERTVELASWGDELERALVERWPDASRRPALWIEPGRYLVAECGVLVARVSTVKRARDRVWVGTDAGMHSLVRPAMYGSYHPVTAARVREGARERCFIVGPICESGDVLAEERSMVVPREGDVLIVGVAGAYGYAMASTYNLRARPAELFYDRGEWRVARPRETYERVTGEAT
ncbi:MAG: diaminopimelate decarboxylase [Myxococcales bacterium]|nr:diaminopimelate decarboxylase [Myxococcales bacterium]